MGNRLNLPNHKNSDKGSVLSSEAHHHSSMAMSDLSMQKFTGDHDQLHAPLETEKERLPWEMFNSNFYS